MPVTWSVPIGLAVLLLSFALLWRVQCRTRNAGMVDVLWSYSLGALAAWYALVGTGAPAARALAGVLGLGWGLRLGTHILKRNLGRPEDARYARLREEWGAAAQRRMFLFFELQAVVAVVLSAGFAVVAYRPDAPAPWQAVAALGLWLVAVGGEAVADIQLARFKASDKTHSAVCRRGLWYYSRHPNYFFECLHWVVYVILALGAPAWWLSLLPPVLMAWVLLRLSGIPITEAQSARTRPGYAEYIRTTSALIPWPPQKIDTGRTPSGDPS